MAPVIHMFTGKGGVGKSTCSALTALAGARNSNRTLLVSMDPAHNQSDIFETRFSPKRVRIVENLDVIEVDEKAWEEKYLRETLEHLQDTYNYQSAFGMQNYFKVLKYSPGMEEYALNLAFADILETFEDRDLVVFDMPPTAQSLKFFSLPFLTRIWLKELTGLRRAILKKKEIITRIKMGQRDFEQDRVSERLGEMNALYRRLEDLFKGKRMHIDLVVNPDRLAFSESLRIRDKLADFNLFLSRIYLNKIRPGDHIAHILQAFDGIPFRYMHLAEYQLTGIDALSGYLNEHPVCL